MYYFYNNQLLAIHVIANWNTSININIFIDNHSSRYNKGWWEYFNIFALEI